MLYSELVYDYKQYEHARTDHQKCLYQIYKICFFVSKIHKYEILKMKAQFMKDDNGKIWFYHAKNLIVRKIVPAPGWILTKELDYMSKQG